MQGRVAAIHFHGAVFTNLSRDHLDFHGSMEQYGAAKARLFAWPGLQAAVINLDDAFGRELIATLPAGVRAIGVSSREAGDATLRARNLRFDNAGIGFDLVVDDESHAVQSPLLGRFNVDNLLAVAGVLHALGDSPAQIALTLEQLQPIARRDHHQIGPERDHALRRGDRPVAREVVEIDANYIRGVAKLEERLIILMDLQKILALELKAAGEEGGTA